VIQSGVVYVMRNGQLVPKADSAPVHAGPYLSSDYQAYDCPVTGRMIEGRSAHRENLKRQGCRLLEKGESRDASKNVQRSYDSNVRRILNFHD
jgi:hypothetical protein